MTFRVPKGPTLEPLLFNIYMLPLAQNMEDNKICYHSYADDTYIYANISPEDYSQIEIINDWICHNFLQINKDNTEVIVFGDKGQQSKGSAPVGNVKGNQPGQKVID